MKELFLIFGIAFVVAWIPALVMFLRARRRFSGGRTVTCPETHRAATIRLDAVHAAASGLTGDTDLRVESCNRWGDPVGHCQEGCVGENESALLDRSSSA
jgi:hypothetical protein